ncbi:MAG: rRNA pseudouridine synthase [Butyrivibrio sp.]|jgi:16S rRNA pseudouridine516 synthase|nr:rRNA pseudouridine synthase [Butyrivibrio sp.]
MQRIDKFLCDQNLGTRKQVKEFIKNGMVTINGETVLKPEQHVDETADEVSFGGRVLNYSEFCYYMLYKPQDVVSATTDGRSVTVVDLLKPENVKGLAPVGRLDKDTEGLLLMTNDGMLTHNLLSPRKHVDKDYEVHLAHEITDAELKKLENGVDIGDETRTLPAVIYRDEPDAEGRCVIHLVLHEGRFHQVKRMLEAVGNEVLFLKRISMGSLKLDETLEPGEYRPLTAQELEGLQNS